MDFARHYEDLRQVVGDEGARPRMELGLALFMREGMTAWMRAWPEQLLAPQPVTGSERGPGLVLSRDTRSDVVTVLVTMALGAHRQGGP